MKIAKSSRHAKLTGDFAEHLILYWLSKYGFECARIDHTGIDLIARNPRNNGRMGISVKSRSRAEGKEKDNVRVDVEQLRKAELASRTFGLTPYIAIVVDGGDRVRCFILPLQAFYAFYPSAKTRNVGWKMNEKALARYYEHREVKIFEFISDTRRWW